MLNRTIRAAKVILPLFIALTLTSLHPAYSQNAPSHLEVSIHPVTENGMKFRITVQNPDDHMVHITITRNEDIFYDQLIGRAPFENIFDLSDLEDGNYEIHVSCGKERITRLIHIQTDTRVDRQITLN